MLIGTFQKRPGDAIELPPNVYHFTPVKPDDPSSTHVCEVEDADDIARLLAVKESFFEFKKGSKPHWTPKAVPTVPEVPSERQTVSDQILNMSLKGLRTAMQNKQFTTADLRQARQVEQGKPGNERRDAVIAVIDQFIAGLELVERHQDNKAIPAVRGTSLAESNGKDVRDPDARHKELRGSKELAA